MLPFTQQKEVDYAAVIEKHKGDKSGKKVLMHVHASSHKEEGGADAIVLSHPTSPLAPPHRTSELACHLTTSCARRLAEVAVAEAGKAGKIKIKTRKY
jgi:hypothetical protein